MKKASILSNIILYSANLAFLLIESRCTNSFCTCKKYTRVPIGSKMLLPMEVTRGIVPSAIWTHFVMLHGACDTNTDGSLESCDLWL